MVEWNPERGESHPKLCCQGICLCCLIHLFDALGLEDDGNQCFGKALVWQ